MKTIFKLFELRTAKLAAVFFAAAIAGLSSFVATAKALESQPVATIKPIKNAFSRERTTRNRQIRALRAPLTKRRLEKTRRVPSYKGLHPRLKLLLARVSHHYGRQLIITSGCRSHRHNRQVGGARKSLHLRCMAADFKIPGISKSRLRRYVSSLGGRGGVGSYCGRSIVHLDVGPRRSWYYGCHKHHRK